MNSRKKKHFLLLISLILIILFTTSPVFGGGVVGSGTSGSCTESALNAALAGGGAISFNCGGSHTITLTSQKTITSNTVIDGGNVITLSGGNSTRLFSVENGATLTLQNMVVSNGRSTQNGGALYIERLSTVTITNSTFSNNQGANGGAIAMNGWGPNDAGGVLNVTNSTFTNNVATAAGLSGGGNGGGGIYVSGGSTATVEGSTFMGNQAVNGGGIHVLLSNLTVTSSTFNSNIANGNPSGGGGGAIYIDGTKSMNGSIQVSLSDFSGNHTDQLGGAIFSFPEGTGSTSIDQSTFDGNYAAGQGQGGAIYHQSATKNGPLTIDNSTFMNNYARGEGGNSSSGGALWLLDAPVMVTNSTFYANDATQNSLPTDNWRRGFGGAIRSSDGMVIVNSTIANNTAGFVGGGIAGDDVTLRNTIIANNTGGNIWSIQQNCTNELTNDGNNIQYPQKTTGNWNDYECLGGQTAVNPLLGTLGDYGGPTHTVPLNTGSPAINAGSNCPTTDQRGFARNGVCDIGAYEFGGGIVANSISPSMSGLNDIQTITLTVNGAGFTPSSVVRWNGADRVTTYVSSFVVTAVIPTTDLDSLGTSAVTVYDPGLASETSSITFTVVQELTKVYLPMIMNP